MALPRGTAYAEGRNYRVELANRVVICKVWKKEELTRQQGAACADEMADLFQRLSDLPISMVRGALIDLREAPRSWGLITELALGRCILAFERAGRRFAFLTGQDPDQRLLTLKIQRERGPQHGSVFADEYSAERWVFPE